LKPTVPQQRGRHADRAAGVGAGRVAHDAGGDRGPIRRSIRPGMRDGAAGFTTRPKCALSLVMP
jgi:hypothetical protein